MDSTDRNTTKAAFWQRFRRNKVGVAGGFIIACISVMGIFAYFLGNDTSQFANRQILEIAGESPGFKKQFIIVPGDSTNNCSFAKKLTSGCNIGEKLIPIDNYKVENGSVIIEHYQGADAYTTNEQFSLEQLGVSEAEDAIKTITFPLGTDRFGRDLLSRIFVGSRISLYVGVMSVLLSMFIGILVGSVSGYFGGWWDKSLMWLANVLWSLPTILLAMAISFALKGRFDDPKVVVFIAIGLSMWVDVARLVRGQIFSLKEEPYIRAIQGFGASHLRVITRHILPNFAGPLLVMAAANFAAAILIEAGLSFIGIGIDPPEPSWGGMLSENRAFLFSGNNAFMALAPGLVIMILVMSFNLLGNALRDAFDVKGQS